MLEQFPPIPDVIGRLVVDFLLLLELDHHHDDVQHVKGLMIIIVFDTNLIYLTLFKVHLQLMYRQVSSLIRVIDKGYF